MSTVGCACVVDDTEWSQETLLPSGEAEAKDIGNFVVRKHNSTEHILSIVFQQNKPLSQLILCQNGVGSWTVDTRDFGGFKTIPQVCVLNLWHLQQQLSNVIIHDL